MFQFPDNKTSPILRAALYAAVFLLCFTAVSGGDIVSARSSKIETFFLGSTKTASAETVQTANMTHGGIAGGVTTNSAKIFARASGESTVKIEYSTSPDLSGSTITAGTAVNSATDFTTVKEINGLNAFTRYYYAVLIDDIRQQTPPFPSFKTFPAEDADATFSFAIGSCMLSGDSGIFTQMGNNNPLFFIQTGDFGYPDSTDLTAKRNNFKTQYDPTKPLYAGLLKKTPLFYIWDDHDFATDDSNRTAPGKGNSLQAYKEYVPTVTLANPDNGIWHSFKVANAEFFMLDTRYQRDPDGTPNGSMLNGGQLGPGNQLDWLISGVNNSTAKWKFIITSSAFNNNPGSGSATDSWGGYDPNDTERNYLINNINDSNVILLSGDIHAGGIDRGLNSNWPELASSPLNQGIRVADSTWSEGKYLGLNYGFITVKPESVYLSIRSATGSEKVTYYLQNTRPNGSLIKSPSAPATYLLDNGQKKWIDSPFSFESNGYRWQDIIVIPQSELNSYPVGSNIKARAGTLIKGPSSPKIYVTDLVSGTYQKKWIANSSIYEDLGYKWTNYSVISNSELAGYADGSDVTTTVPHPNGSLIRSPSAPATYLLDNGQKKWIDSPFSFESNGYRWQDIIEIPQSELNSYPIGSNIKARSGTLAKGSSSPKIYVTDLVSGTYEKKWITNSSIYEDLGYKWTNYRVISNSELAGYADGSDLE